MRAQLSACLLTGLALSCGRHPGYGPPAPTPGAPAPVAPAAPTGQLPPAAPALPDLAGKKLAVLPLTDDALFRDERAALRGMLTAELVRRLPKVTVVPVAEIDAALRPTDAKGRWCAFRQTSMSRRLASKGWLTSALTELFGVEGKKPSLLVELVQFGDVEAVFEAPFSYGSDRAARYRNAFLALERSVEVGIVGGLGMSARWPGERVVGDLGLCAKDKSWSCAADTASLEPRAAALSACLSQAKLSRAELLAEGKRCELAGLNQTAGPDAELERCLCTALGDPPGTGRRELMLRRRRPADAPPEPELGVIDVSGSLSVAKRVVHSSRGQGEARRFSTRSWLEVDNLDALAEPLAACRPKAGTLVVAEVDIDGTGHVAAGRVIHAPAASRECIQTALASGAFACTGDGRGATVRLAARWPK